MTQIERAKNRVSKAWNKYLDMVREWNATVDAENDRVKQRIADIQTRAAAEIKLVQDEAATIVTPEMRMHGRRELGLEPAKHNVQPAEAVPPAVAA